MKTILVVREYDDFSRILERENFEIINLPLIETKTIADLSDFETKLENIANYDGIFLTSRHAAEVFRAKLFEKKLNYPGKIYVLGKRSYEILKEGNFNLVFFEAANSASEMMESIASEQLKGKKFLFVRGEKSLRIVPEFLSKMAIPDETIVYETSRIAIESAIRNALRKKFQIGEIVCACFFSPSAAESFLEQFGAPTLHQTLIATIGKTTTDYFERRNIKVDFVAPRATTETFAKSLSKHLKEI